MYISCRFRNEHDDYNVIMVKAIADRLAEVGAYVYMYTQYIHTEHKKILLFKFKVKLTDYLYHKI